MAEDRFLKKSELDAGYTDDGCFVVRSKTGLVIIEVCEVHRYILDGFGNPILDGNGNPIEY